LLFGGENATVSPELILNGSSNHLSLQKLSDHILQYSIFVLLKISSSRRSIALYMDPQLIHVNPRVLIQVEQSGQPAVVYKCKLQGIPCGLHVEGTTSAVSAHLRGHGITRCQGALFRMRGCEVPSRPLSSTYQIIRAVPFSICGDG